MRRVVILLVILVILGVFYSLARQMSASLQAGSRLDEAANDLVSLQRKNTELQKKLSVVESLQFIEQQARDKLNQSRPGERIFIIPQSEIDRVLGLEKKIEEVGLPNWQGWLRLFWK